MQRHASDDELTGSAVDALRISSEALVHLKQWSDEARHGAETSPEVLDSTYERVKLIESLEGCHKIKLTASEKPIDSTLDEQFMTPDITR